MKLLLRTIGASILLAAVIYLLNSCAIIAPNKYCDPDKIRSGESNQHHDSKKMRASTSPHIETIRVAWIHRDGPVYHVRFANMKKILPRVYYEQLPSALIIEGHWVPVDSLCAWDRRSDSIVKL